MVIEDDLKLLFNVGDRLSVSAIGLFNFAVRKLQHDQNVMLTILNWLDWNLRVKAKMIYHLL